MRNFILWSILVSLLIAGGVSYFASSSPDGLEKVAHDNGFADKASETVKVPAPMPDYSVPGVRNRFLSGALAGVAGTVAVFGLAVAAGWVLRSRKRMRDSAMTKGQCTTN